MYLKYFTADRLDIITCAKISDKITDLVRI